MYRLALASGLPTKASLNRLMKAVAAASGQSGKAVASYFINDQTESMNAFAAGQEQGGRGDYSLLTNSCATFCADVLGAGGETVPGITIPNTFSLLTQIAADFVLTLESAGENIECTGKKCPEEFELEAPAN